MPEDAEVDIDGNDCKDTINKRSLHSKNLNGATGYLTPNAKQTFIQFRQAFTKAPILRHFHPECHIRIETDASDYAIGGVLSQLTVDNLGWWDPVVYYSQKMILAKTCYKTPNGELLAIVEAFKTWKHYLKGCKYKVLVFTDHNNPRQFMDAKSLSSGQVRWAQKLSHYHFWIDYYQSKANKAADMLSCFPQRNWSKKISFELKTLKFFIVCSPR